ncbi:MAG: hypothetical protein KGQ66_15770 [Acidobacteriota bacterium]|nr:hypothetical protein [Acidobacteriota bacterium]
MPIEVAQGNGINNYFEPNRSQREDAQEVINKLEYEDIWRGSKTLREAGTMRLDMQGSYSEGQFTIYNLQVQVNGISGSSTVAHALVSDEVCQDDPANQRGVVNKVIGALNQSLDTGSTYSVTGSIP